MLYSIPEVDATSEHEIGVGISAQTCQYKIKFGLTFSKNDWILQLVIYYMTSYFVHAKMSKFPHPKIIMIHVQYTV